MLCQRHPGGIASCVMKAQIRDGSMSTPGTQGGLRIDTQHGSSTCHCTIPGRFPAICVSAALGGGRSPSPRQERQNGLRPRMARGREFSSRHCYNPALLDTESVQNVTKSKYWFHADFSVRGLDMEAFLEIVPVKGPSGSFSGAGIFPVGLTSLGPQRNHHAAAGNC